MHRSVEVTNREDLLQLEEPSVRELVAALDEFDGYPVPTGSLDIAFVDVETCCQLHADFFNDPEPTDVMTFPGDSQDDHAGDIAVCPKVAQDASAETGLPFNRELSLYIVHACLHLAGLKDDTPDNIATMREAESQLMQCLESQNAFLRCSWKPSP
ncbi:MAG: rRNA maturation RNase YbeY [Puniceicoccaceae bacterium]